VIRHGANRLDEFVGLSGFDDNAAATHRLCLNVFNRAFSRTMGNSAVLDRHGSRIRFIFYASQFRPNKNVISLLRAYEYLLRSRYISCRLILTGRPEVLPEIEAFIAERRLGRDIICLYGLTMQELAASYALADLAVNPSLSEGGFPFTFTEALSVGTPVVMARIPVTEEIVVDPELAETMLFDPYDWRDMADRIEYGLSNRQALLNMQMPLYQNLATRTWRTVVDEYIDVLEKISICRKEDE
jgi:glycosyltransferase involved in cell wall biosynthesis